MVKIVGISALQTLDMRMLFRRAALVLAKSGRAKVRPHKQAIPGKETISMFALLPILLLAAQGDAPAGDAAPQGKVQTFIAPSGEPFRVHGNVAYPVVDWF